MNEDHLAIAILLGLLCSLPVQGPGKPVNTSFFVVFVGIMGLSLLLMSVMK